MSTINGHNVGDSNQPSRLDAPPENAEHPSSSSVSPDLYAQGLNPGENPIVTMPENVQFSSSFRAESIYPPDPPPPYPGQPIHSSEPQMTNQKTEVPPLAYLDIMPRMLTAGAPENEIEPTFDSYPTVVSSANQWLSSNPHLMVWKCESVEKKVDKGPNVNMDSTLQHDSTYGFNVYVKGLRLWIIPKDPRDQPQQLGLLTHLPANVNAGEIVAPMNTVILDGMTVGKTQMRMKIQKRENLKATLSSLNEKLKNEPIQGEMMNMETSWDKAREGFLLENYDPDCMCRHEKGGSSRSYIQVIRIFYILGNPAYEEIDIHDVVPQCIAKPDWNKPPQFQTFSDTVYQAGQWLQQQQTGMRIVNIQAFECPMNIFNGEVAIHQNSTEEQELFCMTNYFVKVVRLIFVHSKAASSLSYQSVCLTSKLFVPARLGQKSYESMPLTVWRMAPWLRAAGLPIFGVDTQRLLLTNMSRGCGVEGDHVDTTVYGMRAKYWVTAVRLYFGVPFQEPPQHLLPPTPNWEQSNSSCCVIS